MVPADVSGGVAVAVNFTDLPSSLSSRQVCWAAFKECWVTVSDDSTIRLWDKDGVEVQCFDYYGETCCMKWGLACWCFVLLRGHSSVMYSSDSLLRPSRRLLVSGDSGLKLYVDNINKRMLMACMDRLIRVYDLEDAHPIMKYKGHTDTIRCLGSVSLPPPLLPPPPTYHTETTDTHTHTHTSHRKN